MARPYSNDPIELAENSGGQYFKDSLLLVFANRLVAAMVAGVILIVKGEGVRNVAPLYKYLMISVSNVIATNCQYEALKWITFPTQTLAKCAKMIPVMIWGTIMSRKKYKMTDYLVAIGVMLGCTIFLVSGNIKAKKAAPEDSYIGLLLMLGYLLFDGFTSTFQEKLFSGYQMSIYNQMLYVNLCSAFLSLVFLLMSGKLFTSLAFITTYPQILRDMSVLSFAAVAGQFAITYTIKEFGALIYATVMTIRQFLSVFVSNMLFRHGMKLLQWLGAALVFGSLFYKSYVKSTTQKGGPKVEQEENGPQQESGNGVHVVATGGK